ncbi:hypothetical protein N7467_001241 [Penicillium canescens]|nr:hypothetical protein N7467_001241 [Penicillium canescens]
MSILFSIDSVAIEIDLAEKIRCTEGNGVETEKGQQLVRVDLMYTRLPAAIARSNKSEPFNKFPLVRYQDVVIG